MDNLLVAPRKGPWFTHAWKLVAALTSTAAAIVSVFSFLLRYGVVGRAESHETIGNLGAAWVGVRPVADTAYAVGDTIHFAATITDKSGAILVGAHPTWTTDNAGVAVVFPDGSVIVKGPGATTIRIAVNDLMARARIVVQQRVASVAVGSVPNDSVIVAPEGDRRSVRARALDARGFPIGGLTAQWRVEDTTVAQIDSTGILVGRNPGRTVVGATVNGVPGHAHVVVIAIPAGIATVAGAAQQAAAGRILPQAVVVRVTSRRSRPIEGTTVKFHLVDGQGSLLPDSATTDADGRARTVWTLGDVPGRQTLLANVDRVDSALAIVAEAEPVAANTHIAALQDTVRAPAGRAVGEAVGIRLTDSTGRTLADLPVTWTALDGGSAAGLEPRTDSVGEAHAKWVLGRKVGTQRLRAQIGTGIGAHAIRPLTLLATALAGAPKAILAVSGDGQNVAAGSALRKPIVLRVVDAAGNGVAGATLALSASGGTLRDSVVETDALGMATVHWTMDRSSGSYALTVRSDGMPKLLRVTAHATAAPAANLTFDDAAVVPSGKQTHAKVSPKSTRLVAVVTDAYGNLVPDARVSFSTKNGTVSPARAVTDAKGRVSVTWKQGRARSQQTLKGVVRGTDVTGSYVVEPTATGHEAGGRTRARSSGASAGQSSRGRN